MKSCHSNRIINFIRRKRTQFFTRVTTSWVYFVSNLQGVSIGKNCTFMGKSYIEINNRSEITIGDNCVF